MHERRGFPIVIVLAFLVAGCSQPANQEIPVVKEPGVNPQAAPPKMAATDRLGIGGGMSQQSDDPLGGITFHVDVPDGWEQLEMARLPRRECHVRGSPDADQ